MKNALIRILCLSLILTLCIPMVACDGLLGDGLLGKLFSTVFQDLEIDRDTAPEIDVPDIGSALETVNPDDFTNWPVTEPPVQTEPPTYDIGYPTEPETTDDPIVDTPTTEPGITTEIETAEPPTPPEPIKVIAAKSWDALIKKPSEERVFEHGQGYLAWEQNPIVNIDHMVESLYVFGWFAFYTEIEGDIGYSVNGGEVIYNPSFTYAAEQGVQDHIAANIPGAKSACRMQFEIPVADLAAGTYTFALVAKDTDGNEELVKEFQVIKTLPYVENAQEYFSFDSLMLNGTHYVPEGRVQPGLADLDYTVTVTPDQANGTLVMRGWSGYESTTAVEYGYYVGKELDIVTFDFNVQDRPDLEYAGIKNGTGFFITVPLEDIPAGIHPIGIIAKLEDGTYAQLYSFYLKVIPETEQQTVELGVRDGGIFGNGITGQSFGQRIPLNQAFLEQIIIKSLGTYANNENAWKLSIWQWDGDYATTVSGTPLFETSGANHSDCADLIIDIPIEFLISGDIYYEITRLSGQGFAVWTAKDVVYGVESYVGGQLQEGSYASSIVVGIAK